MTAEGPVSQQSLGLESLQGFLCPMAAGNGSVCFIVTIQVERQICCSVSPISSLRKQGCPGSHPCTPLCAFKNSLLEGNPQVGTTLGLGTEVARARPQSGWGSHRPCPPGAHVCLPVSASRTEPASTPALPTDHRGLTAAACARG